jgi:Fur family transcriptional regulator, peroxide stress response regulator
MKKEIILKLKNKGVKVTPQRVAIIDYLEKNRTHPSAEEIYAFIVKEYPSISLATVYNTLEKLEELNAIQKLKISDDNKVNYEYDLMPHSHFYCRKCKKIYDISVDEKLKNNNIEGNQVEETHIYYKGICLNCLKND